MDPMDPTRGDAHLDPGLMRGTHQPDRKHHVRPGEPNGSWLARRIAAIVVVLAVFGALFYFDFFG